MSETTLTHTPEIGELAAALVAAQSDFSAVPKSSVNPFYKSTFAGLPAIVKAASPILAKHGLAVTQPLGHDGQGDTLTTVLLHKSGQYLADTMRLRPIKDDPQAQGSAITYGKRYAYMAILGLVADDDDDGNAASAAPKVESRADGQRAINDEQYKGILAAWQTAGNDETALHGLLDAQKIPLDMEGETLSLSQRVRLLSATQALDVQKKLRALPQVVGL